MMKKIFDGCLILAAISLIAGLISRVLVKPFILGLEAGSFAQFSEILLLFAIAIGIKEFKGKAKE